LNHFALNFVQQGSSEGAHHKKKPTIGMSAGFNPATRIGGGLESKESLTNVKNLKMLTRTGSASPDSVKKEGPKFPSAVDCKGLFASALRSCPLEVAETFLKALPTFLGHEDFDDDILLE
jgi:hypothetical protein